MTTKIEWADETLNPQGWGCYGPEGDHLAPKPCHYCYAKRMASRMMRLCELCNQFIPHYHPEALEWPYRWKKPRKIFWQSMGDLFHPHTPDWLIQAVLAGIEANPRHINIFLTKNPRRYAEFNPWPANCWLLTTCENQEAADKRIPELFRADARVLGVSVEPMLGPVDFRQVLCPDGDYLTDSLYNHGFGAGIGWLIIGAQTGPGAVKPKAEWVQNLIDQAMAAVVPLFLKNNLIVEREYGFAAWPDKFQEWPK